MSKDNKCEWLHTALFIPFVGFCPNAAAWDRLQRKSDIKKKDRWEYPTTDASCNTLRDKNNHLVIVVCIGDHIDEKDDARAVAGLMVHECMHVWRKLREEMREVDPSIEFEAYTMQWLFQQMLAAYERTRGKGRKFQWVK